MNKLFSFIFMLGLFVGSVAIAEEAIDVRRHHIVEVAEPIHVHIQEADIGPEPRGHLRGIRSDHAAAEHRDIRRCHARHTAQ